MTTPPNTTRTPDIPAQVFEKFLQALGGTGASAELVTRLRKTLLEDKSFNDRALRTAVLGEDSLP